MMLLNLHTFKQSYQNNVAVIGGALSQNSNPSLDWTIIEPGNLLLVRNKINII